MSGSESDRPPTSPRPDSNESWESYDPVAGPGAADFQFSLLEIMAVTLGVAFGLALYRWFPGKTVPSLLGVAVLAGWLHLYVSDWEPRWAHVTWIAALGSYFGTLLSSFTR